MKRRLVCPGVLLCLAVLAHGALAEEAAQDPGAPGLGDRGDKGKASSQAAALLHSGLAHHRAGEYDQAVREFQKAYKLAPQPNYLYLIGESQKEAGRVKEALAAFEEYLRVSPRAPDRQLVQDEMDSLRQQQAPSPVVPAPRVRQQGAAEPGLPPPPPDLGANQVRTVPPPPPPPIYRRAWFWAVIGAVVAGGVAVGLGVAFRPTEPTFVVAPGALR